MATASDPSPRGLKLRHILIGLAVLVLFYVVSFGPVLYGIVLLDNSSLGKKRVVLSGMIAVITVYGPHVRLMNAIPSYGAYGMWWIRLAEGRGT